jgi:nitroimidazol reductase NimA-like FMN-containing flavoprotein (pyridoxamine 5'-phosphate oxidase superfamily)
MSGSRANAPRYGDLAMTSDELDTFLAQSDTIMLASLRRDGSPFVVPVGFDWDGTSFFVTFGLDHAGLHRLRRDPRVSLSVGSVPAFPTRFVVVEGLAHELDDPDGEVSRNVLMRASADAFAAAGIDAERYFRSWIAVGRVAFRIEVTNLVTFDGAKSPKGAKYDAGTRLPGDSLRASG